MSDYTRHAVHSDHYVEHSHGDLFADLGVDVATQCIETREDCVKLTIGDERYEIYPATKRRVIVKHYCENTSASTPKTSSDWVMQSDNELSIPTSGPNDHIRDSPTDRALKADADKLNQYERTTDNPEFFKAVQMAKQAPQEIRFTLPRGHTMGWRDRRRLEKVFTLLVKGDLEGALHHIGKVKTRPPKETLSTDVNVRL